MSSAFGEVSDVLKKDFSRIREKVQQVHESVIPDDVKEVLLQSSLLNETFSFGFNIEPTAESNTESGEKKKKKKKKKKSKTKKENTNEIDDGDDDLEDEHNDIENDKSEEIVVPSIAVVNTVDQVISNETIVAMENISLVSDNVVPAENSTPSKDKGKKNKNKKNKTVAPSASASATVVETPSQTSKQPVKANPNNNNSKKNAAKATTKASKKAKVTEDDDAILDAAIAEANIARSLLAKSRPNNNNNNNNARQPLRSGGLTKHASKPAAPTETFRFISPKDPEITSEQREKLKFGMAKNLVAIGPPRVRDTNWLGDKPLNPPDATIEQSVSSSASSSFTSPFSFGFDAFSGLK